VWIVKGGVQILLLLPFLLSVYLTLQSVRFSWIFLDFAWFDCCYGVRCYFLHLYRISVLSHGWVWEGWVNEKKVENVNDSYRRNDSHQFNIHLNSRDLYEDLYHHYRRMFISNVITFILSSFWNWILWIFWSIVWATCTMCTVYLLSDLLHFCIFVLRCNNLLTVWFSAVQLGVTSW
jgi:hypothetical protein